METSELTSFLILLFIFKKREMISPYVIYLRSQIEENMIKKMQETHVIAVMGNG